MKAVRIEKVRDEAVHEAAFANIPVTWNEKGRSIIKGGWECVMMRDAVVAVVEPIIDETRCVSVLRTENDYFE